MPSGRRAAPPGAPRLGWVVLAGLAAACAPPPTAPLGPAAVDSAQFEQLGTRYLDGAFRPAPDPDDPHLALTPAGERAALDGAHQLLAELRAVDTTRLSEPQRIDWLLLEASARTAIADTILREGSRDPGRYIALGEVYWLVAGETAPDAKGWGEVLAALRDAPRALAIGRGRLEGPPALWITLALETARGYLTFLNGDLRARLVGAPDSLRRPLTTAAADARRALESYVAFLRDTLTPGSEGSWAIGAEQYDRLLRESHFLGYTADSMIAEGRRVHQDTKAALDSLARSVDPAKSWRQLVVEMQSRHPQPGQILEAYRRESHRVQGFLITKDLITIPPCEDLLFVPTPPANRETYAWGGYGGLREDEGVLYGRFFVTDAAPGMTPEQVRDKLQAQNHGWIAVIALHEGYPGHHLQQVYHRRHPRPLRRRFSSSYFGEGWALYAEHWMRREGLFTTTDQRLAQLQMRLWRTARVIVDPSLHTGRMTYDDAVRFFVDEVGLTRSAAEAEVNRYTTWPTQAPSYIIGWLAIERLKADLRRALGDRFDEKRFHETLLAQGSLPPALMRRAVWGAMVGTAN